MMKTNLLCLINSYRNSPVKLLLLGFILSYVMYNGQTTIVSYQFNNNLNSDTTPVPPLNTSLTYNYANGNPRTPGYDNSWLRAVGGGDYLELSIDASAYQNMVVSFDGRFSAFFGTGSWTVYANTGAGNSFQNLGDLQLLSLFGSTATDSFSVALPAGANNKTGLKIRIEVYLGLDLGDNLRIDNLKLSTGTPKIQVYSATPPANTHIPHLSPASAALTTDFGTRQTSLGPQTKGYRVRNLQGTSGSQLTVNSITVSGANPGDFTVSPSSLSPVGVATTPSGTFVLFYISFKPLADGIRTAEINLYSNAAPSPYKFTVMGVGASCSLESTAYVTNNFALTDQTLESSCSAADLVAGSSSPSGSNSLTTQLYPGAQNLYSSATSSLMFRGNTEKTIEFCGLNGVNVAQKKDVAIAFNVAAFTTTDKPQHWWNNPTVNDDTENGLNINSTIKVSVLKPDNTWSDEIVLRGSESSGLYFRNHFLSGNQAVATMGLGTVISNTNSTKYNSVVLNIPASAGVTNLKFRIKGKTENNNKLWLIDDVRILSSNAVYKVWNTVAGNTNWRSSSGVVIPAPTLDEKVFIDSDYTGVRPSIDACECEINPGKSLTVEADRHLQLRGALINNGTVTVNSDGSLIQLEDEAVNTGNILLKRNLSFRNNDRKEYNYLISPVEGANLKTDIYKTGTMAAVAAPFALYYNEATSFFNNSTGAYIEGRSLAVKEPPLSSGALPTAFFTGKPFNGVLEYALAYSGAVSGYNLVGNPYPSNIDLNMLYEDNNTEIESTFRFWDNTVNSFYEQQGSTYDGSAYAIFNAATGTGGEGLPAPGYGQMATAPGASKVPNNIVKTGQGFMVRSLGPGKVLKFANALRLADNAGSVFYGKQNTDDRFWLSMAAPSGITSNMALVYFSGGNNLFAVDDSEAFGGSDDVFSIVENEKLSIDGRSAFVDTDAVTVETRHFSAGSYTFSLNMKTGVFANGQAVYLKDKHTGIITNLNEGNYTFSADAGESTGRFEIIYKPTTILAVDFDTKDELTVYRDGNRFVVKAQSKKITQLELFDTAGRLIYRAQPNALEAFISAEDLRNGMYITRIDQSGLITAKKIVR
ncbi:hypothetical protein FIC_01952 [Flavobacteriaceae bacterium 3519-10]|nr:hypothetical protein FIC_01952 [Flavobacteriaceae bacterium 3519-10]